MMANLSKYSKYFQNSFKNNIFSYKFVKNLLWVVLLLISLKVGSDLRSAGYNTIPEPYIILDEHTNVWHGLSLRRTGIPAAWSILGFYIDQSKITGAGGNIDGLNLSVDGKTPKFSDYSEFPKPVINVTEFDFGRGLSHTRLVQPYIDHPPFGAYILGLFVPDSVKTFKDVTDYDLRQSSLYLAILTQFLIFVFTYQITKKPVVGIISSTIYGTVPSYILLSRYAFLENVLTPLLLISIILIIFAKNLQDDIKYRKLLLVLLLSSGLFAGLVALTKLVGWIFIFSGAVILYIYKFKIKEILIYIIPAIFIGSLYFAWGLYLSPKLFLDLFITQGQRDFIGSINLMVTFFRVSIYRFPVDGWWVGGFLSLLFITKGKRYLPIGVVALSILVSALLVVGANYPWYFVPLIPFMALASAVLLYKFATKPTFKNAILIFFTFVSSSFYWGYGVYQKMQPFNMYRLLFLLFAAIGIYWFFNRTHKKYKLIWYFGAMILVVFLFMLNRRSMFYILENWSRLPLIYTPGTF